jgi:hypothetical protein
VKFFIDGAQVATQLDKRTPAHTMNRSDDVIPIGAASHMPTSPALSLAPALSLPLPLPLRAKRRGSRVRANRAPR